jgi:hypothetical protein
LQRENPGRIIAPLPSRQQVEVLQITKLLMVFEVCDTEAAAVASFSR